MYKLLVMMSLSLSLIGCTTKIDGNFCDLYTQVDMPGVEAKKLERPYQERILANELVSEQCR